MTRLVLIALFLAPASLFASNDAVHFYLDAPVFAESARRAPYAQHVTMGVEREIAPTWTAALDVSYIRGSNLILPVDVNAPSFFDYTGGATRFR